MSNAFETLVSGTLEEKMEVVQELTEARLRLKLGLSFYEAIPDELEYIVVNVSSARFNRIRSEGLASHTVDKETMVFQDDDFKPYQDDIDTYLNAQEEARRGKVRFI